MTCFAKFYVLLIIFNNFLCQKTYLAYVFNIRNRGLQVYINYKLYRESNTHDMLLTAHNLLRTFVSIVCV